MRGTAPGMTILENLALAAGQGGWLSRISKSDKQRFREQLALLDIGLEDRMNHPVGLLSGGQRQALTLLMATMNPPKLLLLDEHTAALDPGTAEKVLNLTSRIVEEHHLTCLMITHNMQSALELGNRILMMDSGDIVLDIKEEEKKGLTVEGLLDKFKVGAGKKLDNVLSYDYPISIEQPAHCRYFPAGSPAILFNVLKPEHLPVTFHFQPDFSKPLLNEYNRHVQLLFIIICHREIIHIPDKVCYFQLALYQKIQLLFRTASNDHGVDCPRGKPQDFRACQMAWTRKMQR